MGVSACGDVTADHLSAITRLSLYDENISTLKSNDFSGLTSLEALDLSTFRFIMPAAEGETLAPEWKVETELIDHDSLTAWLWTYWEGRCHGYW